MKTVITIIAMAALAGILAGCCCKAPRGPFCQSCAMPMDKPELFGTEADGSKSADYCAYCYQQGKFTQPDITMPQMIDKCAQQMVDKKIMPEKKARSLMAKYIPTLKRWNKK